MDIEVPSGNIPKYYGDDTTAPTGTIRPLSAYADTDDMLLFQYVNGSWRSIYRLSALIDCLLLETGDKLLLETSDAMLLE